jgi:hypothetical protein
MPTENIPASSQTSSDRHPAGPPLWMGFKLRTQPTVATPSTHQGSPYKDSPSELLGEKNEARVVGQYGPSAVRDQNAQTNSELGRGTAQSGDQSTMDDRLLLHPNLLIPKYSRTTKYRWGCFRMASSNNVFVNSDHICCSAAHHPLLYCPGDSRGNIPGCEPRYLGGLPTGTATAKAIQRSRSKLRREEQGRSWSPGICASRVLEGGAIHQCDSIRSRDSALVCHYSHSLVSY